MTTSTASAPVLFEVRVPRETVNDDVVTIQTWHAAHGDRVRAKQLVVSIETSKAVLEVEAEAEGYLEILRPRGAEVPIGELVGRVLAGPPGEPARTASVPSVQEPRAQASSPPAPAPNGARTNGAARSSNRLRDRFEASRGAGGAPVAGAPGSAGGHVYPDRAAAAVAISKKAQTLIAEHGIDVAAAFPNHGLIREADVRGYLAASAGEGETGTGDVQVSDTAKREASPSAPEPYRPRKGGLFGDAAVSAKERGGKSVLWLGWNYFWRNWLLGNLARWAPRGVILPVHRLRGVKMGRDVFIDPTAILETAYPENITIGDDVRVTAGCVIMTHIKAPHHLRETGLVPAVLKPVVLEDHCFIGVNSVIMPGVTVGRGAVVASGSVVVTNVPPYSMVQGNPARVIKQFPRPA